jgi:hypothetical protein
LFAPLLGISRKAGESYECLNGEFLLSFRQGFRYAATAYGGGAGMTDIDSTVARGAPWYQHASAIRQIESSPTA